MPSELAKCEGRNTGKVRRRAPPSTAHGQPTPTVLLFGQRADASTGLPMIKDVVVKLSLDPAADPAASYAISLADAFGAHVAGIALAYEPEVLADPGGPGARRFLRVREENQQAASAAAA